MNRRDMLKAGVAAGALGLAPRLASAQVTFAPTPKGWRSYALTARVEPMDGATLAWIPLPTFAAADWQRPGNVTWTGNAKVAERVRDPKYGAEMLRVEWAADQQSPVIEVTTQVQTQDRSVVPGQGSAPPLSDAERKLNLAGHRAAADRRPGEGDRRGHRQGQEGRPRQGARALRVGGRQHLPQSQDARLRRRRHQRDDQDRQPQRQVRRPERALCRPGPLGRPAGARRLRHPRRALAVRLQGAGRGLGERHQGAALPRRGLAAGQRLGAGRSGRRAQGRARGAAGQPRHDRSQGRWPRARRCSAPGRATGSPSTTRTT